MGELTTFEECIETCLNNRDFVTEFNRVCGTDLGVFRGRSVIATMIDQATGYDEERSRRDMEKFVAFVYETMWLRLPLSSRAPQVVEPPLGRSIRELMEASALQRILDP
jgi:hypothetical protein